MRRMFLLLMLTTIATGARAGDIMQDARNYCITRNQGRFSQQTVGKTCDCYEKKMASYVTRLSNEYIEFNEDFASVVEHQEGKKFSDEFIRICLFNAASKEELQSVMEGR